MLLEQTIYRFQNLTYKYRVSFHQRIPVSNTSTDFLCFKQKLEALKSMIIIDNHYVQKKLHLSMVNNKVNNG